MSEQEKRKFIGIIEAMSEEELLTIVELIPVELCAKRVWNELNSLKDTERAIRELMQAQGQRGRI